MKQSTPKARWTGRYVLGVLAAAGLAGGCSSMVSEMNMAEADGFQPTGRVQVCQVHRGLLGGYETAWVRFEGQDGRTATLSFVDTVDHSQVPVIVVPGRNGTDLIVVAGRHRRVAHDTDPRDVLPPWMVGATGPTTQPTALRSGGRERPDTD